MSGVSISRGAPEPDLRGEGTSALARLIAAGCRGNNVGLARNGPDYEWLNLTFGLDYVKH